MTDRIVLNVNDGIDTIHHNPREECNLDDAEDRSEVDAKTAAAMIATGQARLCEHCGISEAT
jgi:hypothetical protein